MESFLITKKATASFSDKKLTNDFFVVDFFVV